MLTVVGILVFGVLALGLAALIRRIAHREGLLAPVAVGFGVRIVLSVVLHLASVANGNGGFFYLDDHGYAIAGGRLADLWSQGDPGNLLEPLGLLPTGGPVFYQTVAGVFLLTGNSVLAMKIVNVLAGTGTVLCSGILGNRLLGRQRGRRAAWAVALAPTIVWWTLPMLRDPLATFFAAATLAAATGIPRWRNVLLMIFFVAALAFTRSTIFVAVGAGVVAWCLVVTVRGAAVRARASYPVVQRLGALAVTAAVVVTCGVFMGGTSGNISDVSRAAEQFVRVSRTLSAGKAGSASQSASEAEPASDSASEDFQSPVISGIADGGVTTYASAAVRFFVSPRAWAFTTVPFDWYQPLYPAMWLWYALIPVALLGLWRMRTRLDVLALVALPIALIAAQYTLGLNSGVRQRSGVEPLLALMIVAGWVSWAVSLRWASAVFAVLAPLAAIDLRSPWPAVGLLSAAALLFLLSRRLSQREPPTLPGEAPLPVTADMHVERV
jgi:hypothetical protein